MSKGSTDKSVNSIPNLLKSFSSTTTLVREFVEEAYNFTSPLQSNDKYLARLITVCKHALLHEHAPKDISTGRSTPCKCWEANSLFGKTNADVLYAFLYRMLDYMTRKKTIFYISSFFFFILTIFYLFPLHTYVMFMHSLGFLLLQMQIIYCRIVPRFIIIWSLH